MSKAEEPRGPSWTATREHPFIVRHDGKAFRCWVAGPPVSSSGPGIIRPLRWTISVDGSDREGWLADPAGDESAESIEQSVHRWWIARQLQQGE